jgi:hypothetical protein
MAIFLKNGQNRMKSVNFGLKHVRNMLKLYRKVYVSALLGESGFPRREEKTPIRELTHTV